MEEDEKRFSFTDLKLSIIILITDMIIIASANLLHLVTILMLVQTNRQSSASVLIDNHCIQYRKPKFIFRGV